MMKSLVMVAIALICALWVVAIAILSIQNVFIVDSTGASTLVSLKFLGMSSIKMPLGVILSLGAAAGMLCSSLLLALTKPALPSRPRSTRRP